MIKHKKCDCDEDYWEEIVVQKDEQYNYKTVIYFHCQCCNTDFRVEDFFTGEEVFYSEKTDFTPSKSSSEVGQQQKRV